MQIELADITSHEARRGIPVENLTALRAFLAARRLPDPTTVVGVHKVLREECWKLPTEIQQKLAAFIVGATQISFFVPDGNPRPEWQVFHGRTWEEAREKAGQAQLDIIHKGKWGMPWMHDKLKENNQRLSHSAYVAMDKCSRRGGGLYAQYSASDAIWPAVEKAACELRIAPAGFCMARPEDLARQAADAAKEVALSLAVDDIEVEGKEAYRSYAARQWEVWEKGYALLGEVEGVFYVACMCNHPAGDKT